MLAIDQGDYAFLEKILKLPALHIAFHHLAYAQLRKQLKLAELLKLSMTQEHAKEDYDQQIVRYEKNKCIIGPHLEAELEKRKRYLDREKLH